MLQSEIVVVGAGPAGLSAALEASAVGARVTIIDEDARPGGQYYKQPSPSFTILARAAVGRSHQAGQELMARVAQQQIALLTDTLVWGAFEPGILELYRRGRWERIQADRIVVATGAYDRPIAFPGWTLPGVMTAGAAQTLVKAQWVLPGNKVLMVGAGPFQLPVATQLVKAGVRIVGILEATPFGGWLRQGPGVLRHPDKLWEAAEYGAVLLKARVPMKFGWTILEARGTDRVQDAVIGRVDENWRPIGGTEKVVEADTICLGFGFIPSLQLPRLLGCQLVWDRDLAAWVVAHDADQRTTVSQVFVAGETTGIGGHEVALGEGAVAGIQAAADLGKLSREQAEGLLRKVRGELEQQQRFAGLLNRTFSIRPGIYDLAREETILCRCEEVTAGQVASVASDCQGSLQVIKRLTRAGMGPCQGRMCHSLVTQVASRMSGRSVEALGVDTPRAPIKPIPLEALTEAPL